MKVGVPKEVKNHEYRVGLTPASVKELTQRGHFVFVETQAGAAIGFTDDHYQHAGAHIVSTAASTFSESDLIVKVKEPQPTEYAYLKPHHILFTYLHLAPDPAQAQALIHSGCTAIAYETVTDNQGGLPLLAPMSEVAGRLSIQAGACFLEKERGGAGILLGGVAGVAPGKVVILGGGVVGANAARMACGLGADVLIFDKNPRRLTELDWLFGGTVQTLYPTFDLLEKSVANADLVIGAVLVAGASAPRLVTKEMIKSMRPGSVVVDVAIDQGGCFETSRPTTHSDPIYNVDGVIHYCVTNMPGAVARTATMALNNATLPYVLDLAQKGEQALRENNHLRNGLTVKGGKITHSIVAKELGLPFWTAEEALS